MREYALAVHPLTFASRRKIDSVDIALEDLPDWARVDVRVDPDEDFAAYSHHRGNRVAWHYRARAEDSTTGVRARCTVSSGSMAIRVNVSPCSFTGPH